MIIGVCGFIGCGKNAAAEYLVNEFGFHQDSFAGTLKDAVASVFGWPRDMLEGKTAESRNWREQPDAWWAERLAMPDLTPRLMLQLWGTEVCRAGFHNDIWVASLENKLRNATDDVVISDCRFPNELAAIQRAGGKIIWVQRGDLPDWYGTAFLANGGDSEAQEKLEALGVHASETSWVGANFDAYIDNHQSLEHMHEQLKNLVLEFRSTTQ